MPIGKLGGGTVPDLSALDSNPQSVAKATGSPDQTGAIGHRAVQWVGSGLRNLSAAVRDVADSFARAIESRFSGSAKDNFKSLLNRNPARVDTPIELKSFKPSAFDNTVYSDLPQTYKGEYAELASDGGYASLTDINTAVNAQGRETDEYVNIAPGIDTDAYVNIASGYHTDEYIEFDPSLLYSSLSEIATEDAASHTTSLKGLESFVPDASVPADASFHTSVNSHSSPALKQSLNFVRQVINHHGAAGGKALAEAGIYRDQQVIGQVTPELFNAFQTRLKDIKTANAAAVAAGFSPTARQLRFEKFNSENASSPVHEELTKAVFTSAPKLANKVKWEFDRVLASGVSGAQPSDLAQSIARQVLGEELKESFDAGRSDSPLHEVLARSTLANSPAKKLENIKASFDEALRDAALNYAFEGGLDKPFNSAAFAQTAVAVAQATIDKYSF